VPSFWTLGERLLLIQQRSLSLPTARVLIFGRDKDADIARSMEQLFSGESGLLFLTVLHEIFWKTLFLGDRTPRQLLHLHQTIAGHCGADDYRMWMLLMRCCDVLIWMGMPEAKQSVFRSAPEAPSDERVGNG
jgi:hypothetical protein